MTSRSETLISVLILLALFRIPSPPVSTRQPTSCEKLYSEERFSTIVIALKAVLAVRDIDDHVYEISYQEGYRRIKTVRLYKNHTGQTVRNYLQPGDLIKKLKGEYNITVARRLDNAIDVQVFDLSCEN